MEPQGCPVCAGAARVGVLCEPCASRLTLPRTMLREHLFARPVRGAALGWLIDGFGVAHPLGTPRIVVGRQLEADVAVLHGSVSREHAELRWSDDGWVLRDLGSRNRTQLDGRRVEGRVPIPDRARLTFGEVTFVFIGKALALPAPSAPSVATAQASHAAAGRFEVAGPGLALCLLVPGADEQHGGALLYRRSQADAWRELTLPALEYHLMRVLCARGADLASSPSRSVAAMSTRQLARALPFQSTAPDDENVRQVVRRLRTTLAEIGAGDAIESIPGRGYFLGWPVVRA